MGWLSAIPVIGKAFNKTADLIDQAIEDKDMKNQILETLALDANQLYLAELGTKTVPWVDGLHKMGRQILNLITIIGIFVMMWMGHEITPTEAAIIGGPNMVYQFVKGKGKGQ